MLFFQISSCHLFKFSSPVACEYGLLWPLFTLIFLHCTYQHLAYCILDLFIGLVSYVPLPKYKLHLRTKQCGIPLIDRVLNCVLIEWVSKCVWSRGVCASMSLALMALMAEPLTVSSHVTTPTQLLFCWSLKVAYCDLSCGLCPSFFAGGSVLLQSPGHLSFQEPLRCSMINIGNVRFNLI
jgi:hypothetical protein